MASGHEPPAIITEGMPTQLPDIDPDETREWVESLDAVLDERGKARARYLMLKLIERARERQVGVPALRSTDYINSIPPEREPWFPGDEHVERRIRAFIRWNAAVMVSKANRKGLEVGGHIATYQSAASLYEVGFNHFFRGKDHPGGGDQIFIQGHASPGMYARAFLEGRLSADQLDGFRQEVSRGPHNGLSSYPHPRLMPDFWEFPTVSMGLAALNSIYQARFNRYLHHRGIKDTSQQHVWAFLGDGEMGEPESLGAIGLAAREELDNLTFVINCNLQQLDGPGPRQRQDHPGAGGVLPRRRLERHQGDLGPGVGRAARAGPRRRPGEQDEHHAGRSVPDLLGRVRRVHPRTTSSAATSGSSRWSATCPTRTCASCPAAVTTTARCTPPSRARPSTSGSRR